MTNSVHIDINAVDRASGTIDNITNRFSRLDSVANSFMGNFAAGIAIQGLSKVLGVIDSIKNSLTDAMDIQTQFISAANATSINLKVGLDEGIDIQEKLGVQISQAAATQPGSNADYTVIGNMMSAGIAKAYEGKPKEFLEAATLATKNAGLLAVSAGSDASSAGSLFSRFINGTSSFQQLRNNDAFEKNPIFVQKIQEMAEQQGLDIKNLQGWTQKQRIDLFNAASSSIVTPALLDKLNGTADAKLQAMQATLFDQKIGLFGFLRKIPALGDKGIVDTFSGFLSGLDKLVSSVGRIGGLLGLSFDPLVPLGQLINFFTDLFVNVSGFLDNMKLGDLTSLDFTKDIANFINSMIENFISFLDSDALGNAAIMLGQVFNKVVTGIGRILVNIDWARLGVAIAKAIWSGIEFLGFTILTIDWVQLIKVGLVYPVAAVLTTLGSSFQTQVGHWVGWFAGLGDIWKKGITDSFDRLLAKINEAVEWIRNKFSFFTGGSSSPVSVIPNSPLENQLDTNLAEPKPAEDKPLTELPFRSILKDKPQASNFSPVVNVDANGITDPQVVASLVVDRLGTMYNAYRNAAYT